MKAILKLKNKKLYLDWEFGYSKVPDYIKTKYQYLITYHITYHRKKGWKF